MSLALRSMLERDWPHLLELEQTVFADHGYSIYFLRMAPTLFGLASWVAEDNGTLCGYALAGTEATDSATGWLLSTAVLPDYQGQGIGLALVERVCDSLAAAGASRVRLTVSPDNRPALALYRRLGFEEIDRAAAFFGPGQDRLVMERRL